MLKIEKTSLEGVLLIKPNVYFDNRGYFLESYNKEEFKINNIDISFVQDNQSVSKKGVLRGIHYQKLHPQTKLVRVIKGIIYDVAIDLRINSKSFGKHFGVVLSDENHYQLLIPKGFGHAFYVLSDEAIVSYKVDTHYVPNDESGLIWSDKFLNIQWPLYDMHPIISNKDLNYPEITQSEFKNKLPKERDL